MNERKILEMAAGAILLAVFLLVIYSPPNFSYLAYPAIVVAILISLLAKLIKHGGIISSFLTGASIEVKTEKQRYKPGESVSGTVSIKARSPIRARVLSASLIGEEWVNVSCGSGKSRKGKWDEVILFRNDSALGSEKEYGNQAYSFSFEIPANAPPTISASDAFGAETGGGLRWYVEAKLNLPNAPDIKGRAYIFVE